MCIAKNLMAVLLAAFALTAADAIAKDVVYRWVDDKGVVHFSDRSAKSADAEEVAIQPGKTVNTEPASDSENSSIYQQPSQAQQRRDARAKNRQKAIEREDKIAAACEQRRQVVARLEPSPRVMVEREDGEVYRMDDNERLKVLGEVKSYIAENCDD